MVKNNYIPNVNLVKQNVIIFTNFSNFNVIFKIKKYFLMNENSNKIN